MLASLTQSFCTTNVLISPSRGLQWSCLKYYRKLCLTISNYYHTQSKQETIKSPKHYQESEQKQPKMDFNIKAQ